MRGDLNIRRVVGTTAVAIVVAVGLPASVDSAPTLRERTLSFYHTHTRKTLRITYMRNGEYLDSALATVNDFLSDFRTGDVIEVDPELLDLIYDLRESLGSTGTFEVISAYRSPATNAKLRSRSNGVARHSQHMVGKAIDVRLRGTRTSVLRDAAIAMHRGGVGYYEASDFVHVDTGRVRRW